MIDRYPNFEPTDRGMADMHREIGRLLHLNLEKDLAIGRMREEIDQWKAVAGPLMEPPPPGKCSPVVDTEAEPDSDCAPVDIRQPAPRRKGG